MAAQEAVSFRIALQKSRLDLADAQREGAESRAHLAESIGVPVRRAGRRGAIRCFPGQRRRQPDHR